MTRIILCRHAEPGNTAQAEELALALATSALGAVYASPLTRAVETARAVAAPHRRAPMLVEDLREIDFGEVEGLGFDDYPPELQAGLLREPTTVRFPGGETYGELKQRVAAALREIVSRHHGETICVIAHAGPIRAALASWLEMPDEASFRLEQHYAAVNVVDWIDAVPVVRLVNGLPSPAALGAAL